MTLNDLEPPKLEILLIFREIRLQHTF